MSPVHSAPRPAAPSRPVQHGAAGEVHPGVDQGAAGQDLQRVAGPELDVVRAGHPFPVGLVHVDRDVAEGPAPLVHRRRGSAGARSRSRPARPGPAPPRPARRPDRTRSPTARCRAGAGHQQCALPDRDRRLRCPRRTAPAPPPRSTPRCPSAASSASEVQRCPDQPTYWRSSEQIGHRARSTDAGYCTPHVRQIGFARSTASPLGPPALAGCRCGSYHRGRPAARPVDATLWLPYYRNQTVAIDRLRKG